MMCASLKMNKKFLWMLSAGHLFTDMNQGAPGVSIGGIADENGLAAAFRLLAFAPLAGAIVSLTLRRPQTEKE
jgi:hypothetical protein